MKLKYFGTAAYEAFPALGCNCDACVRAWAAGGKNLRSRTQALINDDLLLDFPADTIWHFMQYRIDMAKVAACLVSHSHSDHLYVNDVEAFGVNYTPCSARKQPLHFFVGKNGYDKLLPITQSEKLSSRVDVTQALPFECFSVVGYQVLPVRAKHDINSSPVNYRIEKEGKSLLFAHDTGWYEAETWSALQNAGRLDLVSLDCTGGFKKGWTDHHLSLDTCLQMFAEMEKRGIIDGKTVKIVNHFSHNGGATYDDMAKEAEQYGVITSYDGMEIEF